MSNNKKTRLEKKFFNAEKIRNSLLGSGKYVYKNNTKGELTLPKTPLSQTTKVVPIGGTFTGDNYFMVLVKSNILTVVERLEEENMEKKLIVEVPPTVTTDGTVEFVEQHKNKKMNEQSPDVDKNSVLLTEDPVEGIVILE